MNNTVKVVQVRILIDLVFSFKVQLRCIEPEGLSFDYLLSLAKSITNLQRSLRLADTYCPFIRYLPSSRYKDLSSALSYDALKKLNESVLRHNNLVNDTFLFEE